MAKSRLLIFGIDGGTPEVIQRLQAKGKLPHLATLARRGAAGILSSVVPPLTAPAWATFQTGLNPGRHGIFDFLRPPGHGYDRRVQNASALGAVRIFDALSAAGRTVGAVNVPFTFPAKPVNGFMIPGMLTPAAEDRYFYPPTLGAEVRRIGRYFIDMNPVTFEEGHDDDFIEELYRVEGARRNVALGLWERFRPDFFIVVFTGVDRLMHFFWDRPELVDAHYEWLDETLGQFLAGLGTEDTVMVISDHGFGGVRAEVDLAAHLTRAGFMRLGRRRGPTPRRVMDLIAALDVFNLRQRLPAVLRTAGRAQIMKTFSVFAAVDWKRTRAFPGTATQYAIYLNVAGREPEGIVKRSDYERVREEVIASLDELWHGLAARALRREEVYFGPALDGAPDIYLPLWEDGVRLKEFSDDPAVAPRRARPGEHRREGIFYAAGPAVTPGTKPDSATLTDIFPTVMFLLDEALPAGVDGRLLEEIIAPEALKESPPRFRDYGGGTEGYLAGEDAEVRERLAGMGYLG